jgi:hypothetical protein
LPSPSLRSETVRERLETSSTYRLIRNLVQSCVLLGMLLSQDPARRRVLQHGSNCCGRRPQLCFTPDVLDRIQTMQHAESDSCGCYGEPSASRSVFAGIPACVGRRGTQCQMRSRSLQNRSCQLFVMHYVLALAAARYFCTLSGGGILDCCAAPDYWTRE